MAFFSVVIPTYNRAHLIEKTISTIQYQSFKDWECIIVDDGSKDTTREVVEGLIAQDERIKYVYQENAERSAARNNGIRNATGKYICFLDSDDAFLKHHLQYLFEKIQATNYAVAMYFTNYILSQNGEMISNDFPSLGKDVINYLFYNPIIPARACIHHEILKEIQFDEEIVIVEDLLLWVKIAMNFPLFHLEESTVIYNLHEDNSINIKNNSAQKRLDGLLLFFEKYPEITRKIPVEIRKDIVGDTHFNIMKYYLYQKNKSKAIRHLMTSIFYQKKHAQLKHKLYILYSLLLNKKISEYDYN